MLEFINVSNDLDLKECFNVRYQVFTLEQGYDKAIDIDKYDQMSKHILVRDNGKAIGCLRYYLIDNYYKIGRVCILKEYRNKGFAKELIYRVINDIEFNTDIRLIKLSSQVLAKEFYLKCNFKTIGDEYLEEGTLHILMEYNLDSLIHYRYLLDLIDPKIKELLLSRLDIIKKIALYKANNKIPILDTNREEYIIDKYTKNIKDDKLDYYILLLKDIIKVSKLYQNDIINKNL